MAGHRLSTKMDTVMMRVQPLGHQLEVEVEVEPVQTEPGLVIVEIIEDSLTAMVKNLVELLINLVSSKIELLRRVSRIMQYIQLFQVKILPFHPSNSCYFSIYGSLKHLICSRVTGFHRWANLFSLNFFTRKTFI